MNFTPNVKFVKPATERELSSPPRRLIIRTCVRHTFYTSMSCALHLFMYLYVVGSTVEKGIHSLTVCDQQYNTLRVSYVFCRFIFK